MCVYRERGRENVFEVIEESRDLIDVQTTTLQNLIKSSSSRGLSRITSR